MKMLIGAVVVATTFAFAGPMAAAPANNATIAAKSDVAVKHDAARSTATDLSSQRRLSRTSSLSRAPALPRILWPALLSPVLPTLLSAVLLRAAAVLLSSLLLWSASVRRFRIRVWTALGLVSRSRLIEREVESKKAPLKAPFLFRCQCRDAARLSASRGCRRSVRRSPPLRPWRVTPDGCGP